MVIAMVERPARASGFKEAPGRRHPAYRRVDRITGYVQHRLVLSRGQQDGASPDVACCLTADKSLVLLREAKSAPWRIARWGAGWDDTLTPERVGCPANREIEGKRFSDPS